MTVDSGAGAPSLRVPFEAGFFSRAQRDQAARPEAAPNPSERAEHEAAAPPVRPVDPPARAADEQTRRGPDSRSGQLLSFDAIAQLQGEDGDGGIGPGGLDAAARAEVRELSESDRRVRAHERAHAAAGGAHAGLPTFSFETGPDGRRYAVAGEVAIDVSPVAGDPRATIEKADQVKRAALAPAEPSPRDRQVARAAEALRRRGQIELDDRRAAESIGAPKAAAEAGIGNGPTRPAARADNGLGSAGRNEVVSGLRAPGSAEPPERLRASGVATEAGRRDSEERRAPGIDAAGDGNPDGSPLDATPRARPGAGVDLRI